MTKHSDPPEENRVLVSRAELEEDFRVMVLKICCPHCGEAFTDGAVNWGNAWVEGRIDGLRECDLQERDGPYKIKCEWCEKRSFIDYFAKIATKVAEC